MFRLVLAIGLVLALTAVPTGTSHARTITEGVIAYQRDPKGGISVVPAAGGKSRTLSTRHGQPWYMGQGLPPVWSPDGKWIAIVDARRVPRGHVCLGDDDYECPSEIYVIRPDGTGERRVTPTYEELYAPPVWSPDSRHLAFAAKGVLRVVGADGTGLRRLDARASAYVSVGSWSPDGETIAYTETTSAQDVFLVALEGGRTRLTRDGRSANPVWSPNGRWIALQRDTPVGGLNNHLYVMKPDGTGQRALVKGGDSSQLVWSPDSRMLAYSYSAVIDDAVIATVDVANRRVRQLTPNSETSTWRSPSWSPDGSMLVVTRYGQERDQVWAMARSGGAKRRIVDGGNSASWQPG